VTIDLAELRRLPRVAPFDFWIAVAAIVAVFSAGVLAGAVIGVALSLDWLIYVATRPPMPLLGREPGTHGFRDLDENPDNETFPGIVVLRLHGGLFFATAEALEARSGKGVAAWARMQKRDALRLRAGGRWARPSRALVMAGSRRCSCLDAIAPAPRGFGAWLRCRCSSVTQVEFAAAGLGARARVLGESDSWGLQSTSGCSCASSLRPLRSLRRSRGFSVAHSA
jgi:hypothetical protein